MNSFYEVDSFEDFCKVLAKNIAKAHHGGPNLTDWTVYASNKDVVHMVLAHFINVANQNGVPAPWVMKFIAGGLARILKNKVPWPTVSRGGGNFVLSAFVQYINERYPGHQSDIAEELGVDVRTVHNYLTARSDRITTLLNQCRVRLKDKKLPVLLHELPDIAKLDKKTREAIKQIEDNVGSLYCDKTGELSWDKLNSLSKEAFRTD